MSSESPYISCRDDYTDFYTLQTRWMDNDVYGQMNNVAHYAMFDTAVNGWLMRHGLLHPDDNEHYGLVVESGCRYHGELAFPHRVNAGLRISKLGNSSVRYELGLFRDDEQQASAEGFFVHVYVNRQDRTPTAIPVEQRTVMKKLLNTTK